MYVWRLGFAFAVVFMVLSPLGSEKMGGKSRNEEKEYGALKTTSPLHAIYIKWIWIYSRMYV